MANKLLVNINSGGSPSTLDIVFRELEKIGKTDRLQPTLMRIETNVTPRGVRSLVSSMLDEGDTVLVASATVIVH